MVGVNTVWYEGEDCMHPTEVAPADCRVGRPNLNGSISGYKAHVLPPHQEDRTYSHYDRGLVRRVTYPHTRKNEAGSTHPSLTTNVLCISISRTLNGRKMDI